MRLARVTDAWLPRVDGVTGILDEDLHRAALAALRLDRAACRTHALAHTWEAPTRKLLTALAVSSRLGPADGQVAAVDG